MKSDAMEFLEAVIGGPLTFGALLRSIRLSEKTSLKTFAIKLGVSPQTLSLIEQNRHQVGAEQAAEWAAILGYRSTQFVELALRSVP